MGKSRVIMRIYDIKGYSCLKMDRDIMVLYCLNMRGYGRMVMQSKYDNMINRRLERNHL